MHSLVIRDMLYRNFQTSLRTRIQDGGGCIIVATRWHTDDLAGRLLQNEAGSWKAVSFPAIAVEDEQYRKQGEALSPERYSLESLSELQESLGEYTFNSLFQQNPAPETGSLLKRYKWRYWQYAGMNSPPVPVVDDKGVVIEIAPEELPEQFDRHVQSWDLSFTGSATSDYVCGLDIRTAGPKRYITDAVHERLDFSSTIRAVENFRRKHPSCSGTYIEATANGAASINLLEQRLAGINKVNATKSKYDRAQAASDELNAGNWYVPHPQIASWTDEFLFECSAFPRYKHDDFVDASSQAAGQLTSVADYSMFTSAVNVFAGLPPSYFRKPWEW